MFIGFYAEWRAGSRGRDDTAPPAKEPICRACVQRRSPRCTGRCPAARRFSCPRACGPLRWEGRAIPARRRAILFCPLRSAIACRQICRNARSEEKRFRICMIGPLFQLSGSKESARLPIPIWILSWQSASPSGEMASVSSSKRRTFAPETERLPNPRSISAL